MSRPVDGEVAPGIGGENREGHNHVWSIRIDARSPAKPDARLHPIFRPNHSAPGIGGKPIVCLRIVDLEPDVIVVMPSENGITVSLSFHQGAGAITASGGLSPDMDIVNPADLNV